MVVVSHSADVGGQNVKSILQPWGLGNIAVMVFFCLSGYIIAEAIEVFYRKRLGKFLLNRALRIIPPYLAALVFSILVHLWLSYLGKLSFFDYSTVPDGIFSFNNQLSNFLLIIVLYGLSHVGLQPDYPFVRYVWAVRVEIHFYIVYAMLFWAIMSEKFSESIRRHFLLSALLLLSALHFLAISTEASFLNYFNFAPYFMLGVTMFLMLKKQSVGTKLVAIALLALCINHFALYISKGDQSLVWEAVVVLVFLFGVIPVLAKTRISESLKQIDRWLGDLSYPIYLNHYVVTIAVLSLIPSKNPGIFMLCIILSVAISWAIANVTEPMTKRLRNEIRGAVIR